MMPIQLSNISNISTGTLSFTDLSGSEKALPQLNSLVNIHIIEKVKDGYKVLIDGKTFLSNIPIHAAAKENIIGKVISYSPFILSLDNILSAKSLEETLSVIISKLNLASSIKIEKILRSFLMCRKPIVKSRLEKISEILESNQIDLDEEEMTDAILFLESDETNYQSITPSLLSLFQYKNSSLAGSILNLLQELNTLLPPSVKDELNTLIVLKLNPSETFNPLIIRDYSVKLEKVEEFITMAQERISEGKASTVLQQLSNTLLISKFRQALSFSRGSINGFIIVNTGDKLELIEYDANLQKKNFTFNLNMNPENLGLINVRGLYSSNTLSADITSGNITNAFLMENRSILEKALEDNAHCRHKVTFNCMRNGLSPAPVNRGKLNVTL